MSKMQVDCKITFGAAGATITPVLATCAGRQGENNATLVNFQISGLNIAKGVTTKYRVDAIDGAGGVHNGTVMELDNSKAYTSLNISYNVPRDVTIAGGRAQVFAVITAFTEGEENYSLETPPLTLMFANMRSVGSYGEGETLRDINAAIKQAEDLLEETQDAANEAFDSETQAKNSAAEALSYANIASEQAETAKSEAEISENQVTLAKAEVEKAKEQATLATTAATSAKKYAEDAKNSENTATLAATNAETSLENAGTYARDAKAEADQAGTSSANAFVHAQNAAKSSALAESYKTKAENAVASLTRQRADEVLQSGIYPNDNVYIHDFNQTFYVDSHTFSDTTYINFGTTALYEDSSMMNIVGSSLQLYPDYFYRVTFYFDSITDGCFGGLCSGLTTSMGMYRYSNIYVPVKYGENCITLEFATPDNLNSYEEDIDGDGIVDVADYGFAFEFKNVHLETEPTVTAFKIEQTTSKTEYVFYTKEETEQLIEGATSEKVDETTFDNAVEQITADVSENSNRIDELLNAEINLYSDDAPVWVESSNDEATQYRYGFMTLVENLVLEEGKDYELSFSIGFQYTYDDGDSLNTPPNFSFVKKTSNDEYVAIGGSVHDTTVTDGVCKGQLTFSEGVGNGDILYLSVQELSYGTFDPKQSGINIDSVGNLEELIHYLNSENQKIKKNIGDIETALDGIITLQEELIGGGSV